ncbi:MAG: MFS transporter [Treponemataceae bacterium]
MILPTFFLYTIYGVMNAYLPLILKNMNYSVTSIGFLLAIFEFSGLLLSFIVSSFAVKKSLQQHGYAQILFVFALLMVVLPSPFILKTGFCLSAIFLTLYSVGFKGSMPFSDTLINMVLGDKHMNYGRIRVAGSIGYVCMTLSLQFWGQNAISNTRQLILWLTIPAILFTLSLVFNPLLFSKVPLPVSLDSPPKSSNTPDTHLGCIIKEIPRSFWVGMLIVFLYFLGTIPYAKFLPLYVEEYLKVGGVPLLFGLAALSEVPFMFYASLFLRRFQSIHLIVFCCIALFFRNLVYVIFPSFEGAVFGQLLNSLTYGLFHTSVVLFIVEHINKRHIVLAQTLYSLIVQGFASVFGSIFAGQVIDLYGYKALFIIFSFFPLSGGLVYFWLKKKVVFNSLIQR